MHLDRASLLRNLTLEEKAGLVSGADSWWTKAVDRLGIPAIMVSDGPHGLRTQTERRNGAYVGAVPAVCFPAGVALTASFDPSLAYEEGSRLGEEARGQRVHTVLGPAVNLKRSPLCGRNFEYLSEDPYLTGVMATAYVRGVQSQGIGVSLKHFAANNQETRRMSVDEHIDERTLRELYLAAFEMVVKEAHPWTVMCSYNRINGSYSSENAWLLDDVLRKEWGFDGVVMTDWGAMNDPVKARQASLDLEMPGPSPEHDKALVRAVREGKLPEATLDAAVERILAWIDKGLETAPCTYDREAHHAWAREAEAQCAVLLRNERHLLPLASFDRVLFVGPFARTPRYQGGGSSHIRPIKLDGALDFCAADWLPGWGDDGKTADPARLQAVLDAAPRYRAVVVFAGLPDAYESEGYDRTSLALPACQDALIDQVASVQSDTVVLLHVGSPVTMPWKDKVGAILNLYLGGEAVGSATVDLLTGKRIPSGKLPETFPLRLEDTPAYTDYGRGTHDAWYGERVFIGYRWYDDRKAGVLFPFGFGLSYTTFGLDGLELSSRTWSKGSTLEAKVRVTNLGSVAGSEVVQLYVGMAQSPVPRPPKELKGFRKVFLEPGESKVVSFVLDERSFAFWDVERHAWHAAKGTARILVGTSSRDLPLVAKVEVREEPRPVVVTDTTTIGDVIDSGWPYPRFDALLKKLAASYGIDSLDAAGEDAAMYRSWMLATPLHSLAVFAGVPYEQVLEALR